MDRTLYSLMQQAITDFMSCKGLDQIFEGLIPKIGISKEKQWQSARKNAYKEDMHYAHPNRKFWNGFNV